VLFSLLSSPALKFAAKVQIIKVFCNLKDFRHDWEQFRMPFISPLNLYYCRLYAGF
jgi:hypothetical protein